MKLERTVTVLFSVSCILLLGNGIAKVETISEVEEDHAASAVIRRPYSSTPTDDAVKSIQHTINTSDGNNYKTYAYIPENCTVHNHHEGNYQGGIQIGNNLYLVEHNQLPNLKRGNLVKIDLASYNRLGLNQPGHTGDIVKAFHYFNPKTSVGRMHKSDFNHFPKRPKHLLRKMKYKNQKLLKRNTELQS